MLKFAPTTHESQVEYRGCRVRSAHHGAQAHPTGDLHRYDWTNNEGQSSHTDSLFDTLTAFPHLLQSLRRAASGKRNKPGVAAFLARQEKALIILRDQLQAGTWHGGGYTVIEVHEPKARRISAAPFADRVVHHALCSVIAPVFERGFIHDSYANRTGYGQHRAVARYEHYRDRYRFVLRCDIYRYFPSIDHAILKRDYRRSITCPRTLALMDTIVDGSNSQEPVNILFPGDDLITLAERRRGLPLGNLTSQLFGNLYLNGFDHFVKEKLRAPYLRFVDDFALFANDRATLERWQVQLAQYLAARRLLLHPRKTFIAETAEPALFLGYVLHRGGMRTLPPDNVNRFCGRLHSLRTRWKNGEQNETAVRQRIQSWVAHAAHADTWRLRRTLFRGGWFDPALEGLPTRAAGRLVEQQRAEYPCGESQQQHPSETEQQQRFSSCQIALPPEPLSSRTEWASSGAFRVGNAMAAPAVRFGCEATDGVLDLNG